MSGIEYISMKRKEYIYDRYYYMVENPKDYDKITRKEMINAILNLHKEDYSTLYKLCSYDELQKLKEIAAGKINSVFNDKIINLLESKFIVYDDYQSNKTRVIEGLEESVQMALDKLNAEEIKAKDEINYLIIGLVRIHLVLTIGELFEKIKQYSTLKTEKELLAHLEVNQYLSFFVNSEDSEFIYDETYDSFIDELCQYVFTNRRSFEYTYPKEDVISIGKNSLNLNDKDILAFYNYIKEFPLASMYLDSFRERAGTSSRITDFFEMIYSSYFVKKEPTQKDLDIVMKAFNKMPCWLNDGVPPFYAAKSIKNDKKTEFTTYQPPKIERNEPCPCGSDKKYKKCCLNDVEFKGHLNQYEIDLFYDTLFELAFFINDKYKFNKNIKVLSDFFNDNGSINSQELHKVLQKMWDKKDAIAEFIVKKKNDLTFEQIGLVDSWKNAIRDTFMITDFIDRKAIFTNDKASYLVTGIADTFSKVYPKETLPKFVKATLLPFKDKIIYDSIISIYALEFTDRSIEHLAKNIDKDYSNIIKQLN